MPDAVRDGESVGHLGDAMRMVKAGGTIHVVTRAGAVLSTGDTRWRQGARKIVSDRPAAGHGILLHQELTTTSWFCPISGVQLAVDVHRKDETPLDDVVLDFTEARSS